MAKKVISLFLVLLLFTVSSFDVVFAANKTIGNKSQISSETYIIEGNKYTVKVIEDNNSIRKVFVEEANKLTVVTYNKDTGEFEIKEIEKITGEKKEYKLESKINNISKQEIKGTIDNSIITPLYLILLDERDLWWGYGLNVIQYTGQNDYVWNLYTSKSAKSVYENSRNANDLYNFESSLDSMIRNQYAAIAATGGIVAGIVASAIAGVETVGIGTIIGLLAGAGGVVSAAIYIYNAKQDANHCDYYFNRVQF